jgi:hypothetical protein
MDRIRDREHNDRRGRGGGEGRFDRGVGRRPRRDSRSPSPPRRRRREDDDFSRPTRGTDSYVPSRGNDRAAPPRSRRSPSYGRSPGRDRSRTPHRRRRRSSTPPSSSSRTRRRRNTSSRSSSIARRRGKHGRDHSRSARRRSPPRFKRARRESPSLDATPNDGAAESRPGTSSSASSAQKDQGSSKTGSQPKDLLAKASSSKDGRLSQEPDEVGSAS